MKTENEVKHTATPWNIKFNNAFFGENSPPNRPLGITELPENAVFIVRAVNSHEALLEELIEQKMYMEQQVFVPGFTKDSRLPLAQKRYLKLCKAIAQASGE